MAVLGPSSLSCNAEPGSRSERAVLERGPTSQRETEAQAASPRGSEFEAGGRTADTSGSATTAQAVPAAVATQANDSATRPETEVWAGTLPTLQAWLQGGWSESPARTVGILDGNEAEIFGWIIAARVAASGLFILDRMSMDVRWFRDGRFIGRIGRAGSGPGEFREPSDLIIDSLGNVHVLDTARGQIAVFSVDSSGASQLMRTIKTPVFASSFCQWGATYYLLAPDSAAVLHHIDAQGSLLRSVGKPFPLPTAEQQLPANWQSVLLMLRNRGKLVCAPARNTIVVVNETEPVVRAFRPDGSLLWETEVANHRSMRHVMLAPGGPMRSAPDPETQTAQFALTAVLVDSTTLAVSYQEDMFRFSTDFQARYEVRLLSLASGREFQRAQAPGALAGISRDQVFAIAKDPFPHIGVYAVR